MTGHWGLYLATRMAVAPEVVRTTTAAALHLTAAVLVTSVASIASPPSWRSSEARSSENTRSFHTHDSASLASRLMVSTQATGKSPLAVSPDSITQSAPSITAFATSLASALVGRGLVTMDSRSCVAQIA